MQPKNKKSLPNLLTVTPFTRIKYRWMISDPKIQEQLAKINPNEFFINFEDTFDTYTDTTPELFKKSFVNVVTETVFDYPNVFVSEKTYKPIFNKRPFILVSSPGSLQRLQTQGFQTFHDFWDESYDTIVDATSRMEHIIEIVNLLCQKTTNELQDMCREMSPILEYNYHHLCNNFIQSEKNKFESACQKNLQGIR